MVHFGFGYTGDCMKITLQKKLVNDNIDNFPDGMYYQTRMQLLAWILKVPTVPIETVDIKVKIKMMRGIHTFRRDRTTQVISCNPWSTRLHPCPSLIKKNESIVRTRGQAWCPTPPATTYQHLFT